MPIMPFHQIAQPADLATPKEKGAEELLGTDLLLRMSGHQLRFGDHWREKISPDFGTFSLGSGNHAPMAAAIGYDVAPDLDLGGGMTPRLWWVNLLTWETGGRPTPPPKNCGYLGHNEPASNTYDGWPLGAIARVRSLALSRGDRELVELTGRYFTRYAAMLALMAVPVWPRGTPKTPPRCPYVAQVGARSTPLHYAHDPRSLCLGEIIRWPQVSHPHPGGDGEGLLLSFWYLQAFALLKGDTGVSEQDAGTMRAAIGGDPDALDRTASLLAGCTWMSWEGDIPFLEICRWPDVVAAVHGRVVNFNTGAILASKLSMDGSKPSHIYPWKVPKGAKLAKPHGMESGRAFFVDSEIVVKGHFEERIPIPPEPPLRRWALDREGIRLAGSAPISGPVDSDPPPAGEGGESGKPSLRQQLADARKQFTVTTLALLAQLEKIERSL